MKDLEKALDPSIWPLRVRVREYIHYSNKPKSSQNSRKGNSSELASHSNSRLRQQSTNQDVFVNTLQVPTANRFAPLNLMGNAGSVNPL